MLLSISNFQSELHIVYFLQTLQFYIQMVFFVMRDHDFICITKWTITAKLHDGTQHNQLHNQLHHLENRTDVSIDACA